MKPSFYLEPDAEKMRSFFRTFSLHEDLIADLKKSVSVKFGLMKQITAGNWSILIQNR